MNFLAFSNFRTFYFRKILAFTFHYTIEAGVLVRTAVQELAREYLAYRENTLYHSVMNVIIKANEKLFKEESDVCEAIIDLFRDEHDKGVADAKELGVQQGIEMGIQQGVKQGIEQNLVTLVLKKLLSVEEFELKLKNMEG